LVEPVNVTNATNDATFVRNAQFRQEMVLPPGMSVHEILYSPALATQKLFNAYKLASERLKKVAKLAAQDLKKKTVLAAREKKTVLAARERYRKLVELRKRVAEGKEREKAQSFFDTREIPSAGPRADLCESLTGGVHSQCKFPKHSTWGKCRSCQTCWNNYTAGEAAIKNEVREFVCTLPTALLHATPQQLLKVPTIKILRAVRAGLCAGEPLEQAKSKNLDELRLWFYVLELLLEQVRELGPAAHQLQELVATEPIWDWAAHLSGRASVPHPENTPAVECDNETPLHF
jgi:hypothetical protein